MSSAAPQPEPVPVERGQELEGELCRHRQRRSQDGRDAEGKAREKGKDVDPDAAQADGAGETVATRQHHDSVMAAVGYNGHYRDPASQGEPHEAFPAAKINLVALGPRAAGFKVPSRIHQDARTARQRGLGFTGARGTAPSRRRNGPTPGTANRRSYASRYVGVPMPRRDMIACPQIHTPGM
jgi:hypothetical protein